MSGLKKLLGALVAAVVLHIPAVAAQDFPSGPVRIVIPTTSGGGADIMAREIAQELTRIWDQPVVIDNRPGGGVLVGSQIVADAEPDGHTLLFTYADHIYYPSMHDTMPYDAIEDFVPITRVATIPQLVVAHPSLDVSNISELITLLRENPGEYNFGSAGIGSSLHLAGELFSSMADVEMVHIPYQGTSPASVDLLSGQVHLMFPTVLSLWQHVETGSLKALAVTSPERVPTAPDIPTVSESGLEGYSASIWYAVLAPGDTPPDIVEKLNADFVQAIETPAVRATLEARGAQVETSTSEELDALMRSEFEKWGEVIRAAGIKIN